LYLHRVLKTHNISAYNSLPIPCQKHAAQRVTRWVLKPINTLPNVAYSQMAIGKN